MALTPETLLWQTVVLVAVTDAVTPVLAQAHQGSNASTSAIDQRHARAWITGNGDDYRATCTLAGIDPDMLRDRYLAGQIDPRTLVNVQLLGRWKGAARAGPAVQQVAQMDLSKQER